MPRRRKNPRRGKSKVGALSDFQRAYLLTGAVFEFLRDEADGTGDPFPSTAKARAAWQAHQDSLLDEMGETGKPWAWWEFRETNGKVE